MSAVMEYPEDGGFENTPRLRGIHFEAKLREWAIPYSYVEDFDLSAIQVVETAQVRDSEHRYDAETAAEYREQMGAGAVFPPIIVMEPNLLVDGNTRKAAAEALRRRTFPAFLAKFPTVDMAKAYAAAVNQEGGRRLTKDEARRATMTLLTAGYTDEAVSREIGYNATQVKKWRLEKEFAEREKRTFVSEAGAVLSDRERQEIAKVKNEPLFAEVVKLAADIKPKQGLLNEAVRRVAEAPSEAEGLRVLEEVKQEWKPSGPPPHRPVPIPAELKKARMMLPQLAALAGSASLLYETDQERRQKATQQWQDVRGLAVEMLGMYGVDG